MLDTISRSKGKSSSSHVISIKIVDLEICFRGRSLDTIERHWQQAVNSIHEWATRIGLKFAAHKCKVIHFTAPRSKVQKPPVIKIVDTFLPVEESTKILGLWLDLPLSFKKHISVLKTQCKEALNLIRVVAHLKWGGDRDTLLMLWRAIVWSKLDSDFIVYGTTLNTNLRQLDSIYNSGLTLALGAFCTSTVSSMYTKANEAPLEERWLKISKHYYLKTRACIDNPAPKSLGIYIFTGEVGEEAWPDPWPHLLLWRQPWPLLRSTPLRTPSFPPGTHNYDPKRHDLIEGVSKCMISSHEAQG